MWEEPVRSRRADTAHAGPAASKKGSLDRIGGNPARRGENRSAGGQRSDGPTGTPRVRLVPEIATFGKGPSPGGMPRFQGSAGSAARTRGGLVDQGECEGHTRGSA